MENSAKPKTNIFLFVPNLIDYARLLLLLAGALLSSTCAAAFPVCYVASSLLDLADGWAARRFGQASRLGSWLDVVCDNLGRTCLWHMSGSRMAPLFISVEWLAFAANQRRGGAWKASVARQMPRQLSRVFDNGFYNPLGALVVLGLFGLPMVHFAAGEAGHEALLALGIGPVPGWALAAACAPLYAGRLVALAAELYCIWFHILDLVDEDEDNEK